MIETLRIRNLAVVEQAGLELGPGFCALTGETGAGKSIVLGALALLAGSRASAEQVRDGAAEASVEAVLRCDETLTAALRERGIEPEDGSLVVARSVSREGRSRAWIGGRLVPVSSLAELLADRLEISSQHESQSLRRPERHGELLDAFGGLLAEREAVARGHAALRALCAERDALVGAREERERQRDFLAFQHAELEAAAIEPGELEAIGVEHARLGHASELQSETAAVVATLIGDASIAEEAGAADRVDAAARRLEPLVAHDPALAPFAERLRAAASELADLARDLDRHADGIESDPARLAAIEERMGLLDRMRRKYGRTEAELFATRDRVARELAAISGGEERSHAIETEIDRARASLASAAAALSAGRRAAAARLADEVGSALERLDLPNARLEVALTAVAGDGDLPCSATGAESVELLFSANPGEAPRALRRVASGGELSRVFLALKNTMRRAEQGAVLVFDEVDAGIGGRAADRVGALLAELGASHQVLCITHWPQIAAAATTHLRVVKRTLEGRTNTTVEPIAAEARVEELARMAGGTRIGEGTRAHARELLEAAAKPRRARRSASPPGAPR